MDSYNFGILLNSFSSRKGALSLERLQEFLKELNHPEANYIAMQVAGTNGKGSICTLLQKSLISAGIDSGLTVSPHLVRWEERIRIGNKLITMEELKRLICELGPLSQKFSLTPFELITAVAFTHFNYQKVRLAVLEVGLGGRLDATSVHPHRQIVGFASIGKDHIEFLGNNLKTIAQEKAGILSPGCIAVSGPQKKEVAKVLQEEAIRVGAELRWVKPLNWECNLPGKIQSYNSAVALGMIEALAQLGWYSTKASINLAFQTAKWPGRFQKINWYGHELLIDGAHNPAAAKALRHEIDSYKKNKVFWILGILSNKDAPQMIQSLLYPFDEAWIVPIPNNSSWDSQRLQLICPNQSHQLRAADNLYIALDFIKSEIMNSAQRLDSIIVVTGSLYLISELFKNESKTIE